MTPDQTSDDHPISSAGIGFRILFAFGPVGLLSLLVALFISFGPAGVFQAGFPPIEELDVERITFEPDQISLHVVNGGPEPVTVAQVSVDEAFWNFSISPSNTVDRLQRAVITLPYPWVEGEPLAFAIVSSTGIVFESGAEISTITPLPDRNYIMTFALLGVYAGLIPVLIGLLWFPFLRNLHDKWIHFFLSFTIGLLLFLGMDSGVEAIEAATEVASAFQGFAILLTGLILAVLAIAGINNWLDIKNYGNSKASFRIAYAVAFGIGLHNFGEGLAIGSAYSTGLISLGTFLVIGFAIHNTTEGLAIVSPLSKTSLSPKPMVFHLLVLGFIAGFPTVPGAWIGGFSFSPIWSTLFLSIGAGAIFHVSWQIWSSIKATNSNALGNPLNILGLMTGLILMYITGLLIVG
tara:strand:+ start:80 stop:1300 length:1221 start_codon:yes stop_codon:yes gene_type:complete